MIGIIGAMEEEVRELIADMQECEMNEKASMKFYKGKLYGKDAVVVQSGIGKVIRAWQVLWMQRSILAIS